MLVLLTTLQVRSKALASSLLRKSSYPFPSHQGFFNNSKVETLRILRPKQRSNQRQARGLPSSVLHYLVWLKRLLPPVLGAEVVGRSECLKHAMKFHRTKRQLRQEIWMHCRKQHPMHSRHGARVKSAIGFESWWFGCADFPRVWCQGLQQGITDFTGKAKVHHRNLDNSKKQVDITTGLIGKMCENNMIIQDFKETLR